jgi:hypothetical protein
MRNFIQDEVNQALTRHRLPHTTPLKAEILERAQILPGIREAAVRVSNDDGVHLTIDDFLTERKCDPRYAALFPPDPPRISRADAAKLRDNFERIARGEVVVE